MTRPFIRLAAAAVSVGLLGVAAGAEPMQEVTVQAARVVEKPAGQSSTGVSIVDAALSYGVSYADLNLSKHDDVVTLQTRIKGAAKKACSELDRLYPISVGQKSNAECIKAAEDKALARVEELAAAAK